MNSPTKRKMNEKAREYIRTHPGCTYSDLVHAIGYADLSKAYFFNIRGQLRKKGSIPIANLSRSRAEKFAGQKASEPKNSVLPARAIMTVDILESIDIAGLSDELKSHYQTHILPLLKRIVPDGPSLQMVFLSDPPKMEIRRLVS